MLNTTFSNALNFSLPSSLSGDSKNFTSGSLPSPPPPPFFFGFSSHIKPLENDLLMQGLFDSWIHYLIKQVSDAYNKIQNAKAPSILSRFNPKTLHECMVPDHFRRVLVYGATLSTSSSDHTPRLARLPRSDILQKDQLEEFIQWLNENEKELSAGLVETLSQSLTGSINKKLHAVLNALIESSSEKCLEYFLNQYKDLASQAINNIFPLQRAVAAYYEKQTESALKCVSHLAASYPGAIIENQGHRSLLHYVLSTFPSEKETTVNALVTLFREFNPDAATLQDQNGNLPLHLALKNRWTFAAEKLADQYLKGIGVVNSNGDLPLHIALRNQLKSLARILAEHYPPGIQTVNRSGELPIHLALKAGYHGLFMLLLPRDLMDHLNTITSYGSLLICAVESNRTDVIEHFFKRTPLRSPLGDALKALEAATKQKDSKILMLLFDRFSKVDSLSTWGKIIRTGLFFNPVFYEKATPDQVCWALLRFLQEARVSEVKKHIKTIALLIKNLSKNTAPHDHSARLYMSESMVAIMKQFSLKNVLDALNQCLKNACYDDERKLTTLREYLDANPFDNWNLLKKILETHLKPKKH